MRGMNLASLSSSDLKQIAKLLEQREKLQAQVDKINSRLEAFGSGGTVRKASAKSPAKPGKKRGALKEAVIATLKEAGKEGLKVREIADKIGTKPVNIHAWFHSTGKKIKEIKKLKTGKYQMN